jgi:DNA ligase-1
MVKPHITVQSGAITKPLLAARVEEHSLDELKFPVGVTNKIDGIRCLKIDGHAVSRTFKPIPNHHIRTLIEQMVPDGMDMEITMPGYPKGTFQECTGNVMREDSVNDFKIWVIDYVTGSLDEPYSQRIQKALDYAKTYWINKGMHFQILYPVVVHNKEELEEQEAQALSQGFEGIMVRDLLGRYKCGRSTFNDGILIKLKRFEDSEAVIREVEELYHNENAADKDAFGRTKRSTAQENLVAAGTLG